MKRREHTLFGICKRSACSVGDSTRIGLAEDGVGHGQINFLKQGQTLYIGPLKPGHLKKTSYIVTIEIKQ